MWTKIEELPPSARLGGSAAQPGLPVPTLCYSMDVNALNYCRFSLLKLSSSRAGDEDRALVALPNLVESSVVCVSLHFSRFLPLLEYRQMYGSYLHEIGFMLLSAWMGGSLCSRPTLENDRRLVSHFYCSPDFT